MTLIDTLSTAPYRADKPEPEEACKQLWGWLTWLMDWGWVWGE